jgi:DNA-binding MarR family transcriptional regulator
MNRIVANETIIRAEPGFRLDDFLPYQLAVLASRMSRDFARLYAAFGISVPEWRVLAHLAEAGTVSVREIHARVDMDKPKVSRAAQRLEAAGLIARAAHPDDGRLVALSLTGPGRVLVARIAPLAHDYQADVLAALGPAAPGFRDALLTLLGRSP